jgi:hypothetical protein
LHRYSLRLTASERNRWLALRELQITPVEAGRDPSGGPCLGGYYDSGTSNSKYRAVDT